LGNLPETPAISTQLQSISTKALHASRATFAHSLFGKGPQAGIGGGTLADKAERHRLPGWFFRGRRPRVTFSRQKRQALESLKSVVQPVSFRFLVHICDTNTRGRNFVSTDLTFLGAKSVDLFTYGYDGRRGKEFRN
jgi:hypothetical protein